SAASCRASRGPKLPASSDHPSRGRRGAAWARGGQPAILQPSLYQHWPCRGRLGRRKTPQSTSAGKARRREEPPPGARITLASVPSRGARLLVYRPANMMTRAAVMSTASAIPAEKNPVYTRLSYFRCMRSEEHTSELQSRENLVCRLLLEKKKYLSMAHCLLFG